MSAEVFAEYAATGGIHVDGARNATPTLEAIALGEHYVASKRQRKG